MTKTPYERWQERTNNGRKLAAGWVSKLHTPPRAAQYEVRGHPEWSTLTWAYDRWWNQRTDGTWHRIKGTYDWRGPACDYCSVNWGSVIVQAADGGNAEAQAEVARITDENRRCTCYRSGCEGGRCPVHSR